MHFFSRGSFDGELRSVLGNRVPLPCLNHNQSSPALESDRGMSQSVIIEVEI